MSIGRVAHYYHLGREVMKMRVGEFFGWSEALPELMRQEKLNAYDTLLLAGNRGVNDGYLEERIQELGKPVRKQVLRSVSPEEANAINAGIEAANLAWRKVAAIVA